MKIINKDKYKILLSFDVIQNSKLFLLQKLIIELDAFGESPLIIEKIFERFARIKNSIKPEQIISRRDKNKK
tara:strand:+ start:204 stop:419 length:216 start_codon:yes stop_codon:yes gene_type:complete